MIQIQRRPGWRRCPRFPKVFVQHFCTARRSGLRFCPAWKLASGAAVQTLPVRRVSFVLEWFDFWIGIYFDRPKRRIYVLPLPCCGICIHLEPPPTPPDPLPRLIDAATMAWRLLNFGVSPDGFKSGVVDSTGGMDEGEYRADCIIIELERALYDAGVDPGAL